jgi:hypothetical protein
MSETQPQAAVGPETVPIYPQDYKFELPGVSNSPSAFVTTGRDSP